MPLQDAVQSLVKHLTIDPNISRERLQDTMVDDGLTSDEANRAYNFAQVAWGRYFLDGMGIGFSDTYCCFDAAGSVVEQGRLTDEPFYQSAMSLAEAFKSSQGFQRMVLTSADVNSVNSALNAGSKPEDLVMAPAFIFLEVLTADGMRNAEAEIQHQLEQLNTKHRKRPWWKLW